MIALLVSVGVSLAQAADAIAEERVAVVVGANIGIGEHESLRFAEADARRFRDLLIDLSGVRPDRALLVLGGGPEGVRRALTEARGRVAEIKAAGKRVVFLFYYSGHGDEETLHLARGQLALSDLRQSISAVPADVRFSFLDACRAMGREKGVHRGPSFALTVSPDAPAGTVEFQASSIGEAAQESDDLAGAVFTHFLISGMRGAADADADGRVSVGELYAYAYRHTLLRTGTSVSLQHPSITTDLSGAGEIFLSYPAKAAAFLEVPNGAERYLVFSLPSASVVGELSGDSALRLALPPGRFLVTRRAGERTSVAEVDLSWGGQRRLGEADFRPIAREELAARGGHFELRPYRLEPRVGVEYAVRAPEKAAARLAAVLAYSRGAWQLELETAVVAGSVETTAFRGTEQSVVLAPAIALRSFIGRLTITAALGAEARYATEHLKRIEAKRAQDAGFASSTDRSFGTAGPRLGLRLSVPIGYHLAASASVASSALIRREVGATGKSHLATRLTINLALGVSYAF